ncbi:MAG: thiamine-phosphate kinase [Candidatus Methanoperedens sp.]|nr:thiamine-phosphate kinase [Candidatus Methanoperedens nitroreducens]MDJ1420290.1 thiamine-phosphate kinase [Candidatus Methanoperedens sp.]
MSDKLNENNKKLSELGETEILRKIIFPFHKQPEKLPYALGDDCVDFPSNMLEDRIVWKIDPTPLPVSWLIGDPDYYTYGWYSVLINLSDIASMGASPFGLLLSVVAPPDMEVSEFKRFLKGVEDCCRANDTYILGGNMKDGEEFSCTGTALGSVNSKKILKRQGSNEGDLIVVIGELGAFWAAVFSKLNKLEIPAKYRKRLDTALNKPIPRLEEGQIISKNNLATACMDNSDSIVSCCYELAYQNNLDFVITINEEEIDSIYKDIFMKSGVKSLTAAFSWGDWNLVCTIPPNNFKELQEKLENLCPVYKIGKVQKINNKLKNGSAYYIYNDELRLLNKEICSERFKEQSYFTHGIYKYMEILKTQNLWI